MHKQLIHSVDEYQKIAQALISKHADRKIIAFNGEMGAGKTTFIKAICNVLGVKDTVTSPTFSIVNEYKGNNNQIIYHFDFYRIENIEEAYNLGYEDYFYSNAYCFIEWPDKIKELLPENTLFIELIVEDNGRCISF